MEKIRYLFETLKTLNFWNRLFHWKNIKRLLMDAYLQLGSLEITVKDREEELMDLHQQYDRITHSHQNLEVRLKDMKMMEMKQESNIERLKERLDDKQEEIKGLSTQLSRMRTQEEERRRQYDQQVSKVNATRDGLEQDRQRLHDERVREKELALEAMKRQWQEHEERVQQTLKELCQRHTVQYLDSVPFNGRPDNTIEICDELIIFDAKSPMNDDLSNFPRYIKDQTERVKKYTNQEMVKKEVYLVVPNNTAEVIRQKTYDLGDYRVYVITVDALEPILLSLKRLEEYEFAEQLSPEDRDHITRIIGKFIHTSKRRVQIDQFFAQEFLDLIHRTTKDLPLELTKAVEAFERAEKLNPPTEKRSKQIPLAALEESQARIDTDLKFKNG